MLRTQKGNTMEQTNKPILKFGFCSIGAGGRALYYAENMGAELVVSLIAPRKSMTKAQIAVLRELGFTVEIQPRKIEIPEEYL